MKIFLLVICATMTLVFAAFPVMATKQEAVYADGFTWLDMTKVDYRQYLPELKSSTLFQDMTDDEIVDLLNVMQPPIIMVKAGDKIEKWDIGYFLITLKTEPAKARLEPRRFKWAMPAPDEPGRLMWEVPGMSNLMQALNRPFDPPRFVVRDYDLYALVVSVDMLSKFYNAEVAPAQGKMLRNMLGIMAQKVQDTRRGYTLHYEGKDIYALEQSE